MANRNAAAVTSALAITVILRVRVNHYERLSSKE